MSRRAAGWLAWSACFLSLALTLLSLVFLVLNLSHPDVPVYSFWIENVLFSVGFSTVGAVIVPRMPPGNRIGWLFCAIGFLWAVAHLAAEYSIYALLVAPGSLPAGEAVSWFFSWPPFLALGLMLFLVLLFPDGRLPGERWRWLARLGALSALVGTVWSAFSPGPIGAGLPIRNPLGIEGLPNAYAPVQTLMFGLIALAVASLLVRRFRARGVERLQIRWFAYAFALAAIGVILKYVIAEPLNLVWLGRVGYALDLAGTAGIPISMGIAILRYRLYDIDLLINRTLVYGALTTTLVAVYFGSVTASQAILQTLTGQGRLPQLAVVASTLAIAALFNPLRRRIQAFIDRRFYRKKFDAAETLAAFSEKLKNRTDLDALNSDLVGVVRETMHPAHVSV
ncbi:MAG: hypothetical protein ACRDTR_11005, partial [Rubrobacter sp.]